MGALAVKSAANHARMLRGLNWLKAKRPAEEVLIIGATLGAANELTRNLVREKQASFGYHRLTLGQLASALARPTLTMDGCSRRRYYSTKKALPLLLNDTAVLLIKAAPATV